jgi:ABC-2 type transport system permease protein
MRAFLALFIARNKEFLRDRATLAWNFLFPFVAVAALAVIFSGGGRELYKVGVLGLPPMATAERTGPGTGDPGAADPGAATSSDGAMPATGHGGAALIASTLPGRSGAGTAPAATGGAAASPGAAQEAVRAFLHTRWVQFVPVAELATAQDKVRHHQYDLLLDLRGEPRYWVNPTNPKGYFLERVLWSAGRPGGVARETLEGREIRYIDWLLPGILGLNIVFSCLFGVGYVIVRYRKGLILRRLKVSPITAVQFICAQIASRLVLVLFVTAVLYFGLDLILHFYNAGSVLNLFLVFALGGICNIALGILVASRTSNEELAGGLLNFATWPMMFLSGVWFSMEGSAPWLIWLSKAFPLTHLNDAARAIMVDGATLGGVLPQLAWLGGMAAVFLALGAALFRWE